MTGAVRILREARKTLEDQLDKREGRFIALAVSRGIPWQEAIIASERRRAASVQRVDDHLRRMAGVLESISHET